MWILFFLIITNPGQFQVEVLETYKTLTAQEDCFKEKERIFSEFKKSYPSQTDKDTFSFVCLKQKEKEV